MVKCSVRFRDRYRLTIAPQQIVAGSPRRACPDMQYPHACCRPPDHDRVMTP